MARERQQGLDRHRTERSEGTFGAQTRGGLERRFRRGRQVLAAERHETRRHGDDHATAGSGAMQGATIPVQRRGAVEQTQAVHEHVSSGH